MNNISLRAEVAVQVTKEDLDAILFEALNAGGIAGWAAVHVYAAKAAGLMNGDQGTGNFRPTDYIKRAESASIMMNAFNKGYLK